ncbi:hypothetical protein V1504DRAFT_485198 [Lipomyces starkeyi]
MSPVNFNMLPKRSGNEALDINSNYGTKIHLVTNGSDWYWTVFSIMSCAALAYIVAAFFIPRKERFFHYTSIAAAMFSALAYFSMASNLGWTGVETEFSHYQDGGIRQLASLGQPSYLWLACRRSTSLRGLSATLVPSDYKWGYFTYGVAVFILVLYNLVYVAIQSIQTLQSASVYEKLTTHFRFVVGSVGLVYLLYPISWALSEGGNVISPTRRESSTVFWSI